MKKLWRSALGGAIAAFGVLAIALSFAFYLFGITFEPPNWLISLLFGGVGAWLVVNAERESRSPKPTKKELENFWGRPHPVEAKHAAPTLPESGWGINETVHQFFADFALFGVIANEEINDTPWRLQEGPLTQRTKSQKAGTGTYESDHLLMLGNMDGPRYGRQFDVFYNQFRVGSMEMTNGWEYSTDNPKVQAAIEIDDARLISAGSLMHFLNSIGGLLSGSAGDYANVRREVLTVMTAAHWNQSTDQVLLRLAGRNVQVEFSGTAVRYIEAHNRRTENARKKGQKEPPTPEADCPASALIGQNGWIEEGRDSGSS